MLSTQDKGLIQRLKRKHTRAHRCYHGNQGKKIKTSWGLSGSFFFIIIIILKTVKGKEKRHWDKGGGSAAEMEGTKRESERGWIEEGRAVCLLWSTSAVVLQIKFSTISTFLLAQKSPQQALILSPTPSLASPLARFLARPHSYSSCEGHIHHTSWWRAAVLAFQHIKGHESDARSALWGHRIE